MMAKVILTPEAQQETRRLPASLRPRLEAIIVRLAAWPSVSGVKWLKHEWTGHGRIRMGDWRVIFTFEAPDVIVVRIKHRSEVYED
jgi:mRNA-degrading endonuclease RelE of RelBE toxin-antitoxin system